MSERDEDLGIHLPPLPPEGAEEALDIGSLLQPQRDLNPDEPLEGPALALDLESLVAIVDAPQAEGVFQPAGDWIAWGDDALAPRGAVTPAGEEDAALFEDSSMLEVDALPAREFEDRQLEKEPLAELPEDQWIGDLSEDPRWREDAGDERELDLGDTWSIGFEEQSAPRWSADLLQAHRLLEGRLLDLDVDPQLELAQGFTLQSTGTLARAALVQLEVRAATSSQTSSSQRSTPLLQLSSLQPRALSAQAGLLAIATSLGGIAISSDRGATFSSLPRHSTRESAIAQSVLVDAQGRIWSWGGGSLHRSSEGARWAGPILPAQVIDVVRAGEGVAALAVDGEALEVLRSEDGIAFVSATPRLTLPHKRARGDRRHALSRCTLSVDPRGGYVVVDPDSSPHRCSAQGNWAALDVAAGVHLAHHDAQGRLWLAHHHESKDEGLVLSLEGEAIAIRIDLRDHFPVDAAGFARQRVLRFASIGEELLLCCGAGVLRWRA